MSSSAANKTKKDKLANTEFQYGVIEGFYGHEWSWQARAAQAAFFQQHNYSFYIYSPKSDAFLRSRWQEQWPAETEQNIQQLAQIYKQHNVQWGLALSPLELYAHWDQQGRDALIEKVTYLDQFQPDILCVLFDDMRGDMPKLAQHQIEITHVVKEHTQAKHIIMCPTYYSYEPILEELFGAMPENYWQDLGAGLDADIEVFWTGDKVCSTAYTAESFAKINEHLQRKVSLWDNYPVNDGRKTSPFLHIKGFENRPAQLSKVLQRHVVNPMNAAFLSQIPLITLNTIYQQQGSYNKQQSQLDALVSVCGEELAKTIAEDLDIFQYQGLETLNEQQKQRLLTKYQQFDHPCSIEICQWLQGYYKFDPACLTG